MRIAVLLANALLGWRRTGPLPHVAGVAVTVAMTAALVKVAWPTFAYWGDNAESFLPLWHSLGAKLLAGEWIGYDPQGWAGANIAGESAYGLYNPVTLANMVLVSQFDNLALAAFIVSTEFLVVLGVGVFLTARSYGARPSAAWVAAVIVPFSGFTLFYEAGNWASGLMSVAWVSHFWWSVRRFARGESGPLLPVVFGALAVTVGNPYSLLAVLVLLAAFAIELLVTRNHRRLLLLVGIGLCLGAVALATYIELVFALPQTVRITHGPVTNDGYLVPSIGDLLGMGSPSLLPQFDAWYGSHDLVPSVYLSWIVLPLLAWVRAPGRAKVLGSVSLVVATVVFLLWTVGPEQVWLFRWPLRLIEYTYLGFAVMVAVLLSRGLARDHAKLRTAISVSAVLYGLFAAWSVTPEDLPRHLGATALTVVLCAVAFFLGRSLGLRGIAAAAVIGTAVVAPLQAGNYAWSSQEVAPELDLPVARDLDRVRAATAEYEGTVLQVALINAVEDPESVLSGRLAFGNALTAAGLDSVNRYTGINFHRFSGPLCFDYRGSVCRPDALDVLSKPLPGYGVPLIDAMGVDTLVVGPGFAADGRWSEEWRTVEEDSDRTVLVRRGDIDAGVAVTGMPGVQAAGGSESGTDITFSTESASGGWAIVGRLAWPGYRAEAEGEALATRTGPNGLLEVRIPAGERQVTVSYQPPGASIALRAGAGAAAGAAALHLLWLLSRRREARDHRILLLASGDGMTGRRPGRGEQAPPAVEAREQQKDAASGTVAAAVSEERDSLPLG